MLAPLYFTVDCSSYCSDIFTTFYRQMFYRFIKIILKLCQIGFFSMFIKVPINE